MEHSISACLSCTSEQIAGVTMFSLTLLRFLPMWQFFPLAPEPGPSHSQTNLGVKYLGRLNCQQQSLPVESCPFSFTFNSSLNGVLLTSHNQTFRHPM